MWRCSRFHLLTTATLLASGFWFFNLVSKRASISAFGSNSPGESPVDRIAELYDLIKHDQRTPFSAPDGVTYTIRGDVVWEKPLGNQLCIIDVNTDPMADKDSAWSDEGFSWDNAKQSAPGVLNHFLYSRIHGYRYRFMYSPPMPNLDAAWIRLPAVSSALHRGCRIVVYLDTDAILPHLRLPMEWLLNYWNVTPDTALALSQEPLDWLRKHWNTTQEEVASVTAEPYRAWASGYDTRGRRAVNGGVLIVQDTPRTAELLRRWEECPAGGRYPGCEGLAEGWPAEQGALNEYVRHDFLDRIREIPCEEAHGYPGADIGCQGALIRHYTTDKTLVHEVVGESIARDVMESMQKLMLRGRGEMYVDMNLR